ncbi:MAG: hypothetical protein K2F88_06855, partial [Duncaniella sp.]|nr:hypothetical protein [Duncaniella sp.]
SDRKGEKFFFVLQLFVTKFLILLEFCSFRRQKPPSPTVFTCQYASLLLRPAIPPRFDPTRLPSGPLQKKTAGSFRKNCRTIFLETVAEPATRLIPT